MTDGQSETCESIQQQNASQRSTLDIIIAVQESQPATDDELRLALLAMSSIEHFLKQDLIKLIEMIREEKPQALLKFRADFAWGTIERLFDAKKKPPREWLGPGGIPGTKEHDDRLKLGKAIFKKATGLDL